MVEGKFFKMQPALEARSASKGETSEWQSRMVIGSSLRALYHRGQYPEGVSLHSPGSRRSRAPWVVEAELHEP